MKTIFFLLIVFNSFNIFFSKKLEYQLVFEYLYSDEKDIFDLELYNRPKSNLLDLGDDIFYSGNIEKIEDFPISNLVNFTKEDFVKNNNKERETERGRGREFKREREYEEKKIQKDIKNPQENINKKNIEKKETIKEEKEYSENEFDMFDNMFFDNPLIKMMFDNDYNKFLNFVKTKYSSNQKEKLETNNNKEQNNQYHHQDIENQRPYVQIIYPNNNKNFPIIKIVKYPNNNYKTNIPITNYPNYNYDPFQFYDEFGFGINSMFKSMESELNKMYRIRLLSEKENINENKISKQKMFLPDNHNIVYFSNKLYFDYIKYLPKSTIILTQRQFAKDIQNYEDYYIFTIKNGISLSSAIAKSERSYYKVKIGQNYKDSTLILISLAITVFGSLFGSILYTCLLKRYNEEDILPVQNLINKFPQYLCLLNILMYFSFINSLNESDGYFVIVKFICLFLYSLFKSIFICILMLLLNGWMTLTFIGWAQKLNRAIPIIIFEILTSIAFELIDFYDIVPYNKLQLYYFRDVLENAFILILALLAINKYYIPLNNKCKYLAIINSDFNKAYSLKKRKMISFSIYGILYSVISLLADYFEFNFIYKYLQNNTLHVIREMIFINIFNLILMVLLLPKKLPYLFTEETDLLKCEYLLGDLKEKNILEINDKKIKNIKKQLEKNEKVQIILVNPFFGKKDGNDEFEELHFGNATLAKN